MAEPAAKNEDRQMQSGFRANLIGASLADLVQFECLAHTHGVFRVTSAHEVGYLFFRAGQVVHAISGEANGRTAALEILSWREGTFEPSRVPWPEVETIETSWQNLLISSAQAQDESGQRFVKVGKEFAARAIPRPASLPPPSPPPPSLRAPTSVAPTSVAPPSQTYQGVVKLDRAGTTLEARGSGTDELAELAAYATRLAQLIGEELGMDALTAFEVTAGDRSYLVQVNDSGTVVAVRAAPGADLGSLRQRLGL